MKLAVIVPTYWRVNGSSKQNILNVFETLYKQKHQDFKLFLIGDCYEKKDEFDELCRSYKKDIFYINTDVHYRTCFKIPHNKWASGGVYALFYGLKQAMLEKYEYYLHLDDDDSWTDLHISEMVDTIIKFPDVDFIASKSKYRNIILPQEHHNIQEKYYNNFAPRSSNLVHATFCINLSTLGSITFNLFQDRINIIDKIKKEEINEYQLSPFDAHCLDMYNKLQGEKKIKCILIPTITCYKLTDGNIPQ